MRTTHASDVNVIRELNAPAAEAAAAAAATEAAAAAL
jgi:hypothetical protein